MRTLCGVILSLILAGCATHSEHTEQAKQHAHDEDEILVLNPPDDYLRHLPDLNLEVVDVEDLPGMGVKLYHLRTHDGSPPHDHLDNHFEKFPGVIADLHHHYDHHAAKTDRTYTAKKAADWLGGSKACGNGLRIGVIDGVVNTKHPAFKGSKIIYRSFHVKGETVANTGHGTAVTSIIAGTGKWGGLLPQSEVLAANVFHKNKKGKAAGSAKAIVHALDWMIHQNVPVVNMSIGGGRNHLIEAAVNHAAEVGIVIVASSGNAGPFSKKKSYPGAYEHVIAVTAVDRFYTSARFASVGDYIDFAAPGVDLWTAFPGGGKAMSGTSFAAPIVTAFAAAAMKRRGLKTAEDIRRYFREHAFDRGKPGRDRYTGWGVVQVPPLCPTS